jgi:hypothetical protein
VGGACGKHGRGEKRVQGFARRPEGKGPLGRPRRRWEDGIKMDLREIDSVGRVEWIHLAQYRDRWRALVNVTMNPRVLVPRSLLVII